MSRGLGYFLVLYLTGIVAGVELRTPQAVLVLCLGGAVCLLVGCLKRQVFIGCVMIPMIWGYGCISARISLADGRQIPDEPVVLHGRVIEVRGIRNQVQETILRILAYSDSHGSHAVHWKARGWIPVQDSGCPKDGDRIHWGPVGLRSLFLPGEPVRGSSASFWKSRGVNILAETENLTVWAVDTHPSFSLRQWISQYRQALITHVHQSDLSDRNQAVILGMLIGSKDEMDTTTRQVFADAGLAHLLAVSGLHVGIVYLLVNTLLQWVRLHKRSVIRWMLVGSAVWGYAALSGFTPSALRASTMLSIYILTRLMRIRIKPWQVIGVSALFHLTLDPLALYQTGMQMSYLAVGGILIWNPELDRLKPANRWLRGPWVLASISLAAQAALLPLLVACFGVFPRYFLLSNLLATPLFLLVFYASLAWCLVSGVGISLHWLEVALDFMLDQTIRITDFLGGLPGNLWMPDLWTSLHSAGWYLFMYLVYRLLKTREFRWTICVLGLLVLLSYYNLARQIIFVPNSTL